MKSRSRRLCILAAAAIAAIAGLAGRLGAAPLPPGSDGPVPPDPSLRQGVLPNGLRYAILPRRSLPGHVSLRLIVQAGSLDERDDERGYAHFVEHMAFTGTTHYPPGRLFLFLEGIGLSFGADLNAETGFTRTIYKLDLPAGRYLPEALQVLRDYADGLTFPQESVDRQRGVIQSEARARETWEFQLRTQWLEAIYAGTPIAGRMPIGDPAVVAGAGPAALRAFYRRCYRPERMIVLVVGDIDPDALETAIGRQFAGLQGNGPAPPVPGVETPPAGIRGVMLASPLLKAAISDVTSIAPDTAATWGDFLSAQARNVVMAALDRRLFERSRADHRIGRAFGEIAPGPDSRSRHYRLQIQTAPQDWSAGLGVLEHEIRRARENGFGGEEVREAVGLVLGNLREAHDTLATFSPARLADVVAEQLGADHPWPDHDAELAEAGTYLSRFTPEDAKSVFDALFAEGSLQLAVLGPAVFNGGAAALVSIWREDAGHPSTADDRPPATVLPRFGYDSFGPPGAIAAHAADPKLGLDLTTFANGVRLNLRPSPGEGRRFGLTARLGRGLADTPRDKPRIELLGAGILGSGALGRNTREEIERLLPYHTLEYSVDSSDSTVSINATGPSSELPFALRLLAADLSDLKPEPENLRRSLATYAELQQGETDSPGALAKNEAFYQIAAGDPRLLLQPADALAAYGFPEVVSWMKRSWLQGPLEVGITGDIDVAGTVAAAAATVGALPRRGSDAAAAAVALSFARKPYRKTVHLKGTDKAAALRIGWPAADVADARVLYTLELAVDGVVERLRLRLREELGATYAPEGGVYRSADQPDFGYAWIDLTFDPAKATALGDRALGIADELARTGMTRDEFARLREPRSVQAMNSLASDDWWLHGVLARAQSEPGILDEVRLLATFYPSVSRDEVNRVAAQHLRSARATAILVIPQASPKP